MARLIQFVISFVTLFFLLASWQISAASTQSVSDIRVLVDVSGSMKQNDPKNLRAPALRMIVGLMPDNAIAGAWTFGEHVRMVVPHNKVDNAWKKQAQQQSKKIHSLSLFTDIEQVLNKASNNLGSETNKNIILLTDGLVDISADKTLNEQSRQRILDNIIPRLKDEDIAVHTIALSDNADHELLRAMSLATDGWYEQVDDADALQRVFLHLFEKAAQRDTVPLLDNNFKIDDSVTQMTLLVFRQQDSKETELILPDQLRINKDKLPSNMRWHSENNYDLITVDAPLVGAWQIDATIDPDNRVMVVTDLKLQTTDLPNNILIGESFDFDASLTEKDQIIQRQDFLKLVDANLKEESEITDPVERSLNPEQKEGLYRTHVGDDFKPGRNDVVVTMTSATFERQRRQSINVVEMPFQIDVERLTDVATRTHRVLLTPDTQLISTKNLTITAMLSAQDGSEWSFDVMKNPQQDQWQLTLAELKETENYTVALQIKGKTVKGRDLFLQPDPIALQEEDLIIEPPETQKGKGTAMLESISGGLSDDEPEEIEEPSVEEQVLDEMAGDADELLVDDSDDLTDMEAIDETEESAESGLSSTVKLAVGNGIILLLIVIALFFWRQSRAKKTNPGDQL